MSETPEKSVTTWQSKIRVRVGYPSSIFGTPVYKSMWEVTTISVNRSKEQRTINTVVGARKGFITVERDLTGTFTVQETDPNLEGLERLAESNDFFDILIEEYTEDATKEDPADKEWSLAEVVAVGCKIETVRTRYDFAMMPMREFAFKFLRHSQLPTGVGKSKIVEQTGVYWNVDVQW